MTIIHADCLIAMATMDDDSVDSIVTDPPYDLTSGKRGGSGLASLNVNSPQGRSRIGTGGFMGHAWDSTGIAFEPETWRAALRVAKPGAHLLAFGGTRTVHRLTAAIEDAGWEIRDLLCWGYATGMPKDGDMALDIDRRECPLPDGHRRPGGTLEDDEHICAQSPAGDPWRGWSTTLKPAWEPIVLARKPTRGSVVQNAERFGVGALNVGGSRIPVPDGDVVNEREWVVAPSSIRPDTAGFVTSNAPGQRIATKPPDGGRWPANIALTDPIFDGDYPENVVGGTREQSGGGNPARRLSDSDGRALGTGWKLGDTGKVPVDTEGAYSRFFLVPKASVADREPIMPLRGNTSSARVNTHATVKPLALMEHLVRLVTPVGGLVLDPFAGSGTTALAADGLGFRWVAIEKEADHILIIRARLLSRQRGLGL